MAASRMPPDNQQDKQAILARRALLLTAALATVNCSGPQDPSQSASSSGAGPSASTTASASASASQTGVEPLAPWDKVLALAPPRGAPKSPPLSTDEAARLAELEKELDDNYKIVSELYTKTPDCDAALGSCRKRWQELGEFYRARFLATHQFRPRSCSAPFGETGSLNLRRAAHETYLAELTERARAHSLAVAAAFSAQGEQEWRKILANSEVTQPMPCLKPCPAPETQPLSEVIRFEPGSAELTTTAREALSSLMTKLARFKKNSRLVVRGHASARENDPVSLGAARARAVLAEIERANPGGVFQKKDLSALSFGAEYPIDGAEPQASLDLRVDFEAAMPN
ncbi:MAG: OmpA family protein [Polyangiaceae bacterium]